ncbi:unnamed protein product, partial [Mesorhabditis belari]|uniref:Uncharacterized protein n=1 Tax=Mesorhabditis belari TaxID=2138241 RepID=A0AAF3EG65_9BILA
MKVDEANVFPCVKVNEPADFVPPNNHSQRRRSKIHRRPTQFVQPFAIPDEDEPETLEEATRNDEVKAIKTTPPFTRDDITAEQIDESFAPPINDIFMFPSETNLIADSSPVVEEKEFSSKSSFKISKIPKPTKLSMKKSTELPSHRVLHNLYDSGRQSADSREGSEPRTPTTPTSSKIPRPKAITPRASPKPNRKPATKTLKGSKSRWKS